MTKVRRHPPENEFAFDSLCCSVLDLEFRCHETASDVLKSSKALVEGPMQPILATSFEPI